MSDMRKNLWAQIIAVLLSLSTLGGAAYGAYSSTISRANGYTDREVCHVKELLVTRLERIERKQDSILERLYESKEAQTPP